MAYNAVLLDKILFQITSLNSMAREPPFCLFHSCVHLLLAYKPPIRYNPLYQESMNTKYYLSAFVLQVKGSLDIWDVCVVKPTRALKRQREGKLCKQGGCLVHSTETHSLGFLHPTVTLKLSG